MKHNKDQTDHHLRDARSRLAFSAEVRAGLGSEALAPWLSPDRITPSQRRKYTPESVTPPAAAIRSMNVKQRIAFSRKMRETDHIASLMEYQDKASLLSDEEIDIEYLPEAAPVVACLGEDLCQTVLEGDFYQSRPVHNLEFSLYVAFRALEYLSENDKRWGSWSGMPSTEWDPGETIDVINRHWRMTWLRTAFRCILCMPIGYIVSQTQLRGDQAGAPSWSPAQEDMGDYIAKWGSPKATATQFFIAPRPTSFSTYARLFGGHRSNVPMLAQAEADFFSDHPNRKNPIWRAYRHALNHVMAGRRYMSLPFWWAYAINHEYVLDPNFLPLQVELHCREGFSFMRDSSIDAEPAASPAPTEPVAAPSDTPVVTTPDTPLDGVVDNACSVARTCFENGTFTANSGGCVFQRVGGRLHVVVPIFWDKLAQHIGNPSLTPNLLQESFSRNGLIEGEGLDVQERRFSIVKKNGKRRIGTCRTLLLTEKAETLLFPGGMPFQDNPDLHPMTDDQEASAA
jgi:hypothetical protein